MPVPSFSTNNSPLNTRAINRITKIAQSTAATLLVLPLPSTCGSLLPRQQHLEHAHPTLQAEQYCPRHHHLLDHHVLQPHRPRDRPRLLTPPAHLLAVHTRLAGNQHAAQPREDARVVSSHLPGPEITKVIQRAYAYVYVCKCTRICVCLCVRVCECVYVYVCESVRVCEGAYVHICSSKQAYIRNTKSVSLAMLQKSCQKHTCCNVMSTLFQVSTFVHSCKCPLDYSASTNSVLVLHAR
jgi:hypothetical protein